MPKNKMQDLRNHLFETLEALKDEEKPMDLDRAKAIADVARVLVQSAKVEVKFAEAVGAMCGGEFFQQSERLELPRPSDSSEKEVTVLQPRKVAGGK